MRRRRASATGGRPANKSAGRCLAIGETILRRLLPLLLAGALAGLTTLPTTAQNLCSPSTATTSRAQGYPGSMPYSNSGTFFTSNCTGPVVDPGITPDPYAGLVLPVPGYAYG